MSLAKGGRRRYRIQVFTLFKECRIDNHDTSFTYRELMNLLPRLDGIDATKKDLVMLKYLSFSQSVRNTIPDITNDEGAEVIEEDDPTTVLARQLSEPFREDYENEPLQTLPAPTTFSRLEDGASVRHVRQYAAPLHRRDGRRTTHRRPLPPRRRRHQSVRRHPQTSRRQVEPSRELSDWFLSS